MGSKEAIKTLVKVLRADGVVDRLDEVLRALDREGS